MANAVIYARFSSSRQREESIEDQVRVCRKEAEAQGDRIIKVYADSAISGKTDNRPQFKRLIADSEKGIFETLYIYKTDRFARNRFDSATYKAKLRKNGVKVVPVAEHIPEGADGILLESLLEGMAEYYSAQLAQNVKRGIEGNAQKCKANGQSIYGYDINKEGYYIINKREAKVVKTMFNIYANGESISKAIEAIKPERPRSGKDWHVSTVSNMLRNERYIGTYIYAGYRKEGGMPAIVDKQTFTKVQERFKKHKYNPRDHTSYVLTGKLFDEHGNPYCGSGGTSQNGTRYNYYWCKETNKRIDRDKLHDQIAKYCATILNRPGMLEQITKLILEAQAQAQESEKSRLELYREQLAKAERQYDNTVDAIADLGMSDKLKKKLQKCEADVQELKDAIAQEELAAPTVTAEMVEYWVRDLIDHSKAIDLLATFVTQVCIDDDGKVLVAFLLDDNGSYGCVWPKNGAKNEKNTPGKEGCSYMLHMVEDTVIYKNFIALKNGFILVMKAA